MQTVCNPDEDDFVFIVHNCAIYDTGDNLFFFMHLWMSPFVMALEPSCGVGVQVSSRVELMESEYLASDTQIIKLCLTQQP